MSRPVIISIFSIIIAVTSLPAVAQNYYELGVMSGTGMVFMPTSSISPNAQFRLDVSRLGLSQHGGHGLNLYSVSSGLSEYVEAYIKFTSEQSGYAQSTNSVDIGGKFTLPFIIPILKLVSVWGEYSTSQNEDHSQLSSPKCSRVALIVTPFANGVRPSVLIGTAKEQDAEETFMIGACVVVSPNHTTQFGIEYLHGYAGIGTNDVSANGNVRLFSNISLHAGPGYMSRPSISGWIWTIGLSLNSADIDFHPVFVEHKKEYKLPSIEEMEKGSFENKKDSSEEDKQ
jgi:hypothetical protein